MTPVAEKSVKLMIAEPQPILLQALQIILKSFNYQAVSGTDLQGEALLKLLLKEKPDILFLDVHPFKTNGISVLKKIQSKMPGVKVIALSVFDHPEHIKKIFNSGARGFISKNLPVPDLDDVLSVVIRGEIYLSEKLSRQMLLNLSAKDNPDDKINFSSLTSREIEIIQNLSKGLKTKEIAEQLFVSNKTVERHKTNILKKLDLHNSVQLVKAALLYGVIES